MAIYEMTTTVEIPEDYGEFQALELRVFEASREAGKKVLEKILGDFEEAMIKRRPVQKKDRRQKRFQTLLGVISFKRWRVKDVFKKNYVYPLDEWMGLCEKENVSPGLGKEIIIQCVERTYQQASMVTTKLTGVKRSASSHWNFVQRFAKKEKTKVKGPSNWKEKALPVLVSQDCDPCPMLAVDPDATYVRPRRKTDTNHEMKMAVLYTSRVKQGKKRWGLGQKQVVISSVRESVSEFKLHLDCRC